MFPSENTPFPNLVYLSGPDNTCCSQHKSVLSSTIWTSTFACLWCLSCEKARNCDVLGLHHSTRMTVLRYLFAVLLLPTNENCNRVIERGENDSSWSVVHFIFLSVSCMCAFERKDKKKGNWIFRFQFLCWKLEHFLIIILAVLDTFFLSRSIINYIH